MKYMYIPHSLIAAKDDIIFSHKKIKENKEKAFHEDLHAFVRRISLPQQATHSLGHNIQIPLLPSSPSAQRLV